MEIIEGSSPPSPSPPPPVKIPPTSSRSSSSVCIVCADSTSSEYLVYITDVTHDGNETTDFDFYITDYDDLETLNPSFRLKAGEAGFTMDAFCVLNSQLYWFAGCDYWDIDEDHSIRSAYKLDLSKFRDRGCDFVLDRRGMDNEHGVYKLHKMKQSKYYPAAIASPDGKKFLVFSCMARPKDYLEGLLYGFHKELMYDFELFDVDKNSWTTLPAIYASDHSGIITSFGFQTNSIFLVYLHGGASFFSLDISNCEDWKRYRHNSLIKRNEGPFCVIDESLLLTSYAIGTWDDEFVDVPVTSFRGIGDILHKVFRSVVVLDEKECTFCNLSIVRSGHRNGSGERYPLVMNVFKFVDDQLSTPTVTSLSTLKYTLIAEQGILYFVAAACLG